MRGSAFLPIHLLIVITGLIVAWATLSCGSPPAPITGGYPSPVPPVSTLAAPLAPISSVSASPALVSGEGVIPFKNLAQGFRLGSAQFGPAVHMAVDPKSRDDLAALVAPEHQSVLKGVDLEREVVLGAFWGVRPSGGFSIEIRTVSITNADLTVNVLLRENDPTVPKIEASTSPYHLVIIDRSSLPQNSGSHYRLVNGDAVLVEGELP
jgi:PrcB C-terminal